MIINIYTYTTTPHCRELQRKKKLSISWETCDSEVLIAETDVKSPFELLLSCNASYYFFKFSFVDLTPKFTVLYKPQ